MGCGRRASDLPLHLQDTFAARSTLRALQRVFARRLLSIDIGSFLVIMVRRASPHIKERLKARQEPARDFDACLKRGFALA